MKKILLTVLTVLTVSLLSGCSALSAPKPEPQVACAKNFAFIGEYNGLRAYSTTAIVPNVTKKDAIDRSSRLLIKQGWQITKIDTESGLIDASPRAGYRQGEVVSLNVVVEQMNKDVEISITYAISGGVTSPTDAIITQFCLIVEAVEKKVVNSYSNSKIALFMVDVLDISTSFFLFFK